MPNAIILGTGSCVPDKVLTNDHFEKVGSNDAWIQERLGIKERRITEGQTTGDLAAGAALSAGFTTALAGGHLAFMAATVYAAGWAGARSLARSIAPSS